RIEAPPNILAFTVRKKTSEYTTPARGACYPFRVSPGSTLVSRVSRRRAPISGGASVEGSFGLE
ncbi:MAG: hypothetical protein L0Z50_16010, partial [Verrucomicrobiales bacterium]|nr:hypothetical protein [Verrucomicrobiales bacterium]